ncbi:MAG: anaerobic ribonucleoside-triphosphate reductase activating protein [Spirochaetes bacterium]|nr:anaerobic ribonucleoside-triphosphate reductase activating protein [Spirochaetota bacterium]
MLSKVALQKTSLVDFPARVAAVVFTPGCAFRCPYCHNPELVFAKDDGSFIPIGELLGFLDRRKGVLSGLVFSGGEPLIHEDLPRLSRAARKRGYAIKLDTNGSFPERMADVEPDYIAIDLKTSPGAYARVAPGVPDAGAKAFESLAVARSLGVPYEVRITCVPGIVGPAELRSMAEYLEPGDEVVLQRFRPLKTLDPAWMSVEPYPKETMDELLAIARRKAPRARIRGG